MRKPETPGEKARKARQRKPKTIEGRAKDVTQKPAAPSASSSAKPAAAEVDKSAAAAGGASHKASSAEGPTPGKKADAAKPASDASSATRPSASPAAGDTKPSPATPKASQGKPRSTHSSSPSLALPLLASGLAGGIAAVLILWGAGQIDPPGETPAPDLGAIEDRLAALENQPAAEGGGVSEADYQEAVARLEGEIENLRQSQASQPAQGEGTADAAAVAELAQRVANLEENVSGAQGSREEISQKVAEIETRIGTTAETLSTVQTRVTELAEAQQARETSAQLRAAAALPVLGSLAEAVAAGRPTASYSDTLAALGVGRAQGPGSQEVPSNAQIEQLLQAARADVPTAGADAASARTQEQDGGVLSQLQSSLSGLVTVRRTDAAEGPSPLDPVAEAIAAGDFAEARERLDAVNAEGEAVAALETALQTRAAFEAAIADETARLANLLSGGN